MKARTQSRPAPAPAGYAELHCLSNFSLLRGASHPEELVEQAAELGYAGLAITDRNSLAGVVRAHLAAREHGIHLIVGAEIIPLDAPPLVLLAPDRVAYGRLARLITRGRLRAPKGDCGIWLSDVVDLGPGLIALLLPAQSGSGRELRSRRDWSRVSTCARACRDIFGDDLYLAAELACETPDDEHLNRLAALSRDSGIPLVAANAVHYHAPERRYLQDVLTCIREKCTLTEAGQRLFPNAERHLRPLEEIARRYAPWPELVRRTLEIARRCTFSLDELKYEYPHELVPSGRSAIGYLEDLTWAGALERYGTRNGRVQAGEPPRPPPDRLDAEPQRRTEATAGRAARTPDAARLAASGCVPAPVFKLLESELKLIAELRYEHYFLTVWDLVRFARQRGILCQGRGSAANSAVCYCLGVTSVDPARIDLLFERFISRERNEPPDIDVDFEHERREEVFQYIYQKYGRERAAITAEVITYRPRSAVRDVGKALGLSLDRVDVLAKALDWWISKAVPEEALRAAGLNPADRTVRMLVRLVRQLLGFPRHLSQHVGGFVITETPLCEIVPLENGAMPERTFIEWDKDDIDALGILKVDCLALGMLTAISKSFGLIKGARERGGEGMRERGSEVCSLADVPREDPAVYDMICAADTVGVFQIESRAQMSMLPRLKPRCFYDLVIEVAIVRPGPIQGGMVHPYLRRRDGRDPVRYPSPEVRGVLEKTLGVPLFQEQVMRLAVVAAGFTAGEADQLRRLMAAWRRSGQIEKLQVRLIKGMLSNGYPRDFAEQIYKQIRGFGEYGFPESHAASFALLVYVSAWLKRYRPAAFTTALLNSQPMGFYAPAQLVADALRHGVPVLPVDVNASTYDCRLEQCGHRRQRHDAPNDAKGHDEWYARAAAGPALRLGFRLVRGLSAEKVRGVEVARAAGLIRSIAALARRPGVTRETLLRLAAADAFRSLGLERREALWQILALDDGDAPLFAEMEAEEPPARMPAMPLEEVVVQDYGALGMSLNAHPIGMVRKQLNALQVTPNEKLRRAPSGRRISVAGLVVNRQRPSTAKGIVFMTLEDETGNANLIVRPRVWDRHRPIANSKTALIVDGRVERQGAVVHVQVHRMHDLSARIAPVKVKSRDFR